MSAYELMIDDLNPLMRDLIDNPETADDPTSIERFASIFDTFDDIANELLLLSPPASALEVQAKAEEFATNLNSYTHFNRYTLGISAGLDDPPTKVILMHDVHATANELHTAGVALCR